MYVNAPGSTDHHGIVSKLWDWGDGTTGSGMSAMYSVPGSITMVSTWHPVTKKYTNWLAVIPSLTIFVLTP